MPTALHRALASPTAFAHDIEGPAMSESRSVVPVQLALRAGLRRFVSRRVAAEHVDDLVQDILLRMQERADDLRDEARLAGWAFRIAQSVVTDHHRAKRKEVSSRDPQPIVERPQEAEDTGNVNEIVAGWLPRMIAFLPDEYREALTAVDLEGRTHAEYAAQAGLSLSGAKSRVQRGRRMLEQVVRACCDLEIDARGNVIGYERRSCGR
jgi:RNA polymerase sigma-70 factor (ECF subfamily)